ncbi:unnamed protein product [Hyaloperonospora brassicae]|uniref:Uncharacterized protein n=1 Tax=Hyaloperonospora brassicae TaxID=162125 RepID=A0AAV0U6B9_HYABA|nr:unnamed protein product [Hyaloperonospora brassicae]
MQQCVEQDPSAYWKGLWHGLLLLLPVLCFLYRKWSIAAQRSEVQQPVLGQFMNELFAFEVVLVAGAELKAVRDQLQSAKEAAIVNADKVHALQERIVDIAAVLQQKLATITPIVSFLLEQSVGVMKGQQADGPTAEDTEPNKDK